MSCGKNIGRIVWFDQKKGFGFVKIMDTEEKEVFFHFSSIQSVNSFKKVYPGEYVSLDIKHQPEVKGKEYICLNLTGVNGGPLLIENEKYNFKVFNKPNNLIKNVEDSDNVEVEVDVEKQ